MSAGDGVAIADAHVHFFSHRFFSGLAAQRGGLPLPDLFAQLGWDAPPESDEELAHHWVRELDRRGVARAALIASAHGGEASVVAACHAHPDRFYGFFFCDPTAPDAVARAKAAFAAGLQGVCLFPAMHRYAIAGEQASAILDLAAGTRGAVAFVHCGALSVGVRKKLGLPSPFDIRYSNPVDLHPVALARPGLPFIVPHFGAGYLREALMVADLCPNIFLDTSGSNAWMRYHAPELSLAGVFRRALDVVGPKRLLFGTDSSYFPRGWNAEIFEVQAAALREAGASAEAARDIFGGNLDRLLGRL